MRSLLLALVVSLAFPVSVHAQSLTVTPPPRTGTKLLGATAAVTEWVYDVQVTQIGSYTTDSWHYVWFSRLPSTCQTVLGFDEASVGGKSVLASLTTAIASGRKVAIQTSGCQILEIYLR